MKKQILLASLLTSFSFSALADISFYSNFNGLGNKINSLKDNEDRDINLKQVSGWKNDEIKSLRLQSVTPGTIIRLYDNPDAKTNDDWVEIKVKQLKPEIIIDNLEENRNPSDYQQKFHRVNGLNGKVSHIKVRKSNEKIQLSLKQKVLQTFNWNDKNGEAHRYKSQDSNYRLWKPEISEIAGRSTVSFKMDHIRGSAKDDHAQVKMNFNEKGYLVTYSIKIVTAEDKSYGGAVVDVANDVKNIVSTTSKDPRAIAVANASASLLKTAGDIYAKAVGEWSDHGGRANFPDTVAHKAADIAKVIATSK